MGKFIDMTGWRMSEHGQPESILTVLKRDTEFDKTRTTEAIRWICQCDCGTIKSISGSELRRKRKPTLSCGCLTQERNKHFGEVTFRDLTNQKFGMLTALYVVGSNKYNFKIWRCKCDCGNEKDIASRELLSGDTVSCGCQKNSYREKLITDWLEKNNFHYQKEYSFDDLKDVLPLRFDFAVFKEDGSIFCLIEHQGQQHSSKCEWNTEKLQIHDQMKKNYCIEHKIPLYEIQYFEDLDKRLGEICLKEGD